MVNSADCLKNTDEQLVELSLANPEYYWCLMNRYEEKLLHYILKISSLSREDAEDILQDVFIKVYENLNDFDLSLKFSNWIYRITHNITISAYRKKRVNPQLLSWDYEELNNLIDSTSNIENDSIQNQTYEKILEIINHLPLKYKEVLILKFLENKDYQEISDILHKPMGTIATLLKRAKNLLQQELIKEGIKT
ncbi:MAG: RNA polymerase sigma factor [Candidatus Caldatribacteriota bacterium]